MSDSGSFAFHATPPDGVDARVILLERAAQGRLRLTEWQAGAYHLPGRAGETTPAEIAERVEGWRRSGWRFSETPARILAWLDS